MKEQVARLKQNLGQRFIILNLLLGLLCFVVLPGLIFLRGVDGVVAIELSEKKQKAGLKLQGLLDQLEFFSENDRFAHLILSSVCSVDEPSGIDPESLRLRINRLKGRFPDSFVFAVADQTGNLLPAISDEKAFSYLYRQAFQLLSDVKNIEMQGIDNVSAKEIGARLGRLKPLIGNMIRPEDLFQPLRGRRAGRSILASGAADRHHFWYGFCGRFQIMVFINRSFIRGNAGMNWAIDKLNKTNPSTITGFTQYPPFSHTLVPKLTENLTARAILAVAGSEKSNGSDAVFDTEQPIACRFLNQHWRGFALFRRDAISDPAVTKARVTSAVLRFLMVSLFVLFVYQLRKPIAITIKVKIVTFFAYAIVLPLLVIASLTAQYITQSDAEMMNDLKNEAYRAIEKLDAHYEWFLHRRASRLKKYLIDEVEPHPEIFLNHASLEKMHDDIKAIANPGEVMITDSTSQDFMLGISGRIFRDRSMLRQAASDLLKIFISSNFTSSTEKTGFLGMLLHADMYELQNKITYLGIGDYELSIFYRIMKPHDGDVDKLKFASFSWELHRLQREHVENYCHKELAHADKLKVAAFCRVREELFTGPEKNHQALIRLMNMSVNRHITQVADIRVNDKSYIAVAMPGRKLNKLILSAMLPIDPVLRHRELIISRARLLAVLLCLLVMATMYLLQSWIFRPLEELKAGIAAIAGRNFHKRLDLVCQNEFGKLLAAFNHSLETLQELEVARIVQESILPEKRMTLNRSEIVAQTRTMTNLGGDYFDMLPLDEQKVMVFIGDATGHGIPAALSMAMAKSVLLHEHFLGMHDQGLMQQINAVFCNLRSQGSKDFMTALCVEINTLTGHGRMINAGHCYPMLLKKKTGKIEILTEIRGLPPGFDTKAMFEPREFTLDSGDSLILFTDGFIECLNEKGRPLGFEGLADLISRSAEGDAGAHLASIFGRLTQWSANLQDDCTMVMVRFE